MPDTCAGVAGPPPTFRVRALACPLRELRKNLRNSPWSLRIAEPPLVRICHSPLTDRATALSDRVHAGTTCPHALPAMRITPGAFRRRVRGDVRPCSSIHCMRLATAAVGKLCGIPKSPLERGGSGSSTTWALGILEATGKSAFESPKTPTSNTGATRMMRSWTGPWPGSSSTTSAPSFSTFRSPSPTRSCRLPMKRWRNTMAISTKPRPSQARTTWRRSHGQGPRSRPCRPSSNCRQDPGGLHREGPSAAAPIPIHLAPARLRAQSHGLRPLRRSVDQGGEMGAKASTLSCMV